MRKAIFLDRDGTVIEERNYICKEEDVILLKNAAEGLKTLQDEGYLLFIVSNQSGVARGYFNEDIVIKINNHLNNLLLNKGVKIEKIYYCPHHKDGVIEKYKIDCDCRKPNTGLIKKATSEYDIDLENSYVIGDKLSDIQLAKNCNCNAILVLTGYGNRQKETESSFHFETAEDLLEAANIILNK